MRKPKLKAYYIEVDGEVIRTEADRKRSAMTEFHQLGYLVAWGDVRLVPAWDKSADRKPDK